MRNTSSCMEASNVAFSHINKCSSGCRSFVSSLFHYIGQLVSLHRLESISLCSKKGEEVLLLLGETRREMSIKSCKYKLVQRAVATNVSRELEHKNLCSYCAAMLPTLQEPSAPVLSLSSFNRKISRDCSVNKTLIELPSDKKMFCKTRARSPFRARYTIRERRSALTLPVASGARTSGRERRGFRTL